ncbi:hypothetical protein HN51_037721 [Arachis hypogaea]
MSTTLLSPTLSFKPRLPPTKPQCFLRPLRFVTVFSPKELSRISLSKGFAVNDNNGAVLGFLIYAWIAVLFELSNWKNAVFDIVRFVGNLFTYLFAILYRFIGSPITFGIRCMEDSIYTVRAFYSWTINNAPIPELTTIIVLVSVVLAIAEATVPNCTNKEPYVLTVSGFIGYAAVRGYISELFFWTLLLGLYAFSKLIKKRDNISCAMTVAAVLAAVGETLG